MRAIEDAFGIAVRTHQAGDWQKAAVAYQEILRQEPSHAGAWHLLGAASLQAGDPAEAVRCIARAIELNTTKAVYFGNFGAALKSLGRLGEAEEAYRQALRLQPQFVDAMSNLGALVHQLGREEEASLLLERAVELSPSHADALFNLANCRRDLGRTEDAVTIYRRAIAAKPGWSAAHNNLGGVLQALGRVAEAIEQFEKAVAVAPEFAEGHLNLGAAYAEQERIGEAARCFQQASRLRPDKPLWKAKTASLCPIVFESAGEIQRYREALARQLDSLQITPDEQRWEDLLADGFSPSFNLKHHGCDGRPLTERFAQVFEPLFPQSRPRLGRGRPRIGFLVTGRHEGGMLRAMGGLIEQLDRRRFEVAVLSSRSALDACRAGIRQADVVWVPFRDDLGHAVREIRESACDLIYHRQIGTDPLNYFLPFARLAPVQCTSWGSHLTTGIAAVDWFLSSRLTEPEGAQAHYTEKLRLLETLPEYHHRPTPLAPAKRHEFGLPEDRNIYLCPGRLAKFHPEFDRLLGAVLHADPKGLILLISDRHGYAARLLEARWERTLGDLARRIQFLPRQSWEGLRRLMGASDVMLDTWHYGASLMAYDAFGVGLPIVTLPDGFNLGRVTTGIYRKMGLEDLVARSPEDYVAKVVAWGTNREEQNAVRARIAERREVLFEDSGLVREHEDFFEQALEEAREAQR